MSPETLGDASADVANLDGNLGGSPYESPTTLVEGTANPEGGPERA